MPMGWPVGRDAASQSLSKARPLTGLRMAIVIDGQITIPPKEIAMARTIRLAGVSYNLPAADHSKGVNLSSLRSIIQEVAMDKPHFICFRELCACKGSDPIKNALELKPFAEEVGKLAKEVGIALVIPFAEREGKQVYNSVPIVDSQGKLVMVYRKNYPTDSE